jgi:hypothetical protein
VVQHETDHLDGRLFIDRLNSTSEAKVRPFLDEFEIQFTQRQSEGGIPPDDAIRARIKELQQARS